MNDILAMKIFGDKSHRYGPYIRLGYRDKETAFNLLDKDRRPLSNEVIAYRLDEALQYLEFGHRTETEMVYWLSLCTTVRDLYMEMRKDDE